MSFPSPPPAGRGSAEKQDLPQRSPKTRDAEPAAARLRPPWPCLLSSIAVAVAPLRNLTGEPGRQSLVEAITENLFSHLLRHGRGFSLKRLTHEPASQEGFAGATEAGAGYVVDGSAQRGDPGTLRVNVRITDAATQEYLWARRYQYRAQELEQNQTTIIRQISRELHLRLLRNEIRGAALASAAEPEPNECLSSAATALEGELRADVTAEARRWFLTALAADPHNVEALTGLARTCQHLVSNPWWADPHAAFAASDLGRETVAVALSLAPGHADAHCIQGMLYSAAGQLEEAAGAFEQALAMDQGLATAHGFAGYNAALLGRAHQTLPAINRAMRLDRAARRRSIWYFFGGFAELLVGRSELAIGLLQKSLELNPTYGSALLFLIAALSQSGRTNEAARAAAAFRQLYPDCPAILFEQLWLSRSPSPTYRAQIHPLFEKIRDFGLAT